LRSEATKVEEENKLQKKEDQEVLPGMPPGMGVGDPTAMMDGMKGNMTAMVQNMVMMQGSSHFFVDLCWSKFLFL
jgi:hypothetical protein